MHTRKHLSLEEVAPKDKGETGNDHDGINVDSDVIVSEYRLLYKKYHNQI
jgi:hypothetical protein